MSDNIKKKRLKTGLDILLGTENKEVTEHDYHKNEEDFALYINDIKPNVHQPRSYFDDNSIKELANSIKEQGLLMPILVKQDKSGINKKKYTIIAGERRWQAAQYAGLHEVPVVVINVDNLKSLEFAIVENVQRKDLNPIEEAEGYKRLIDEFRYDQDKVSKFIGKSRAHISNCLRLLNLPQEIIEFIIEEKLSQGHAKILVGLDNALYLAKKIISKKLSVRQTENLVRMLKSSSNSTSKKKDPNIVSLEEELTDKIGMRVFVKNKRNNSGTISLEYKGADQLDRLVEIIKQNY